MSRDAVVVCSQVAVAAVWSRVVDTVVHPVSEDQRPLSLREVA